MPAVLVESTRKGGMEAQELCRYEIWRVTIPTNGQNSDSVTIGGYPKQAYFFNASSTTTGTIYVRMKHTSTGTWFQKSIGGTAATYNLYGPFPVLGANEIRLYSGTAEGAERTFYIILTYY